MAKSFVSMLCVLPLIIGSVAAELTQVKTTSGIVKGHVATLPGTQDVSEYLGIRFGEDTTGANRFMRPKPYFSSGILEAAKFGPGCPALPPILPPGAPTPPAGSENPQSEDCLFLNVWSKPQVGEKKKAVMVYILGGGFSFGDSATALYNGAKLAQNQDVVVVTLNYRTNIFGFPGAPSLPDTNLAFLDQRLAVEWVRDNIEAFGGNPERITLFGESAGASSTDYYSYIWLRDPIVQAFIAQSGTAMMTGPFAPKEPEERAKAWFNMTTTIGCGGQEAGAATIRCVQEKTTVKQIQNAMPKATGFANTVGFFGPTWDDKTVRKDVYDLAKASRLVHKPLLIGSNNNESTLFTMMGGATKEDDIALNNGFRCGTAAAAKTRVLNHIPVWRYHFAGTKPNSTMGALHGQDVPLIFDGTSGLSKVMQTAWGNFAKDPEHALSKLGWPKYNPNGKTLIRLGYAGAIEPEFIDATTYDGACPPSPI